MAETKHLIDIAHWIENNHPLLQKADAVLHDWEHEVLLRDLLQTPQSCAHHAEGGTVRAHIRLMLASLFAICEGHVRLNETEEFARLRGFFDEIVEMQQMLTENPATFQVFCLVHDLGKPFRMTKSADGEVHYHGHEKEIYRADVRALVGRLASAFKLTDHDVDMLVALTSYHMEPLQLFTKTHDPKKVKLIEAFATDQGLDADDFIDMLQACVLLDQVLGSRKTYGGSVTVDVQPLIHFFIAEREYAPWKLEQKEKQKEIARKQALQRVLKESGLDGHGVMMLTGITAGRELGGLLKKIQEAVVGDGELVEIQGVWKDEVLKRIGAARRKLGVLV